MTEEEIIRPENLVYKKPTLLNDTPMHYCPGCSHGVVHKLVAQVIEEKGMAQNSDTGFLEQLAKDVLANNEKSVNDYKNGKTNALGYLVGQCMKASKGKANPGIVKEIVTKMLSE